MPNCEVSPKSRYAPPVTRHTRNMDTIAPTVVGDPKGLTLKEVKANPKVKKLIDGANEVMKAMGYTEHGPRHVGVVSSITRYILENLGVAPVKSNLARSQAICTTSAT